MASGQGGAIALELTLIGGPRTCETTTIAVNGDVLNRQRDEGSCPGMTKWHKPPAAPKRKKARTERRAHGRVQLELPMTARVQKREVEVEIEALDLSMGGVFVRTNQKWPLGTELTISFEHNRARHKGTGIVVHQMVRNYVSGVGVRFTKVSDEFHNALLRIMEEKS